MNTSITQKVYQIRPGDVEGLQAMFRNLEEFGSFDPSADFQALMNSDRLRPLALIEPYRVLMEPVFSFKPGDDDGMTVTVFRTIHDMSAGEVYNWLCKMKCFPASFEDVALVLEQARKEQWRVYKSDIRRHRIYYPDPDEIFQEQMPSGKPLSFEFAYIPDSLDPADVERGGLESQTVRTSDFVITWEFPEDPPRSWHR